MLVEKYMSKDLKAYKALGQKFHSGWHAAGVGLISLCITMGVIGSFILFSPQEKTARAYNKLTDDFSRNENTALKIYQKEEAATERRYWPIIITWLYPHGKGTSTL